MTEQKQKAEAPNQGLRSGQGPCFFHPPPPRSPRCCCCLAVASHCSSEEWASARNLYSAAQPPLGIPVSILLPLLQKGSYFPNQLSNISVILRSTILHPLTPQKSVCVWLHFLHSALYSNGGPSDQWLLYTSILPSNLTLMYPKYSPTESYLFYQNCN